MISSLTECIVSVPSPTHPWWHAVLFSRTKLRYLKDKSKVWGDFLTRFPLKFAENNDVAEIVI